MSGEPEVAAFDTSNVGPSATLGECRIIELPVIRDARGNLTYAESESQIPFGIQRVFYLYDVPGGSQRAGHALRTCHQFLVAVSGSFDVVLDDGQRRATFHLNRAFQGLYVAPLVWRELSNFSSNSVCLAIASHLYDPADYYRDYAGFKAAVTNPDR
jgi:hypothetical protein